MSWPACWAARFGCGAYLERGVCSRSILPQTYMGPSASSVATLEAKASPSGASTQLLSASVLELPAERIADDREILQPGDAVLLVIEDDPHYARLLCDLSRDSGFKVLLAMRGTEGLALAREFQPTAISLDVFLPDMLGWTVLNHLKQDPQTRHIPVQILTVDEDRRHGLARGAFASVMKPATAEEIDAALHQDQGIRGARTQAIVDRGGQPRGATKHSRAARL